MQTVEGPARTPVEGQEVQAFQRAPSRRSWRDTMLVLLSLVVFLGTWELIVRAGIVRDVILPTPSSVAVAVVTLTTANYFPEHALTTTAEALLGFLIGSACGLGLGIVMTYFETIRKMVYPYVVVFQVMPKVVLAPLFITWFGFGIESKIVTAATITFFPVLINTMLGLLSADPDAIQLMRSLRASQRQVFWKLAWPSALPAIFAGLSTSATIALIGAIVAEFVTARRGLGLLLITFNNQLRMDMVFAVILVISLIGLALFQSVVVIERRVVFWRADAQQEVNAGGSG